MYICIGIALATKAEFDSALADFNARLTTFEAGINSKIDSQVTSYLDRNGIWNGKAQTLITDDMVAKNFFISGALSSHMTKKSWSNVYQVVFNDSGSGSYKSMSATGNFIPYSPDESNIIDRKKLFVANKSGLCRVDYYLAWESNQNNAETSSTNPENARTTWVDVHGYTGALVKTDYSMGKNIIDSLLSLSESVRLATKPNWTTIEQNIFGGDPNAMGGFVFPSKSNVQLDLSLAVGAQFSLFDGASYAPLMFQNYFRWLLTRARLPGDNVYDGARMPGRFTSEIFVSYFFVQKDKNYTFDFTYKLDGRMWDSWAWVSRNKILPPTYNMFCLVDECQVY